MDCSPLSSRSSESNEEDFDHWKDLLRQETETRDRCLKNVELKKKERLAHLRVIVVWSFIIFLNKLVYFP